MALDEQLRELAHRVPPPPSGDSAAVFRRGRRRRRARHVVTVTAAVSVVAVLGVGVASLLDTPPRLPEVADQPEQTETGDAHPAGWVVLRAGELEVSVPPDWQVNTVEPAPDPDAQAGPCVYDLYGGIGDATGEVAAPLAVVYPMETTGVCRAIGLPDRPPEQPSLVIYAGTASGWGDEARPHDASEERIGSVDMLRLEGEPHEHFAEFHHRDGPGGLFVSHMDDPIVQEVLATLRTVGTASTPAIDATVPEEDWRLVSGNVDGEPLSPVSDEPITLRTSEDRWTGWDGCNNYELTVETPAAGDAHAVQLAGEDAGCPSDEVGETASRYTEALLRFNHFTLTNSELHLSGGGVELRFVPSRQPEQNQGSQLPLPEPGSALPAELDDGTPVFVSHLPDGEILVLDATAPHQDIKLVAHCTRNGGFEDVRHGSRFTADGLWLGGPAPSGLAVYPHVRIGRDHVRVTGPPTPQPRSDSERLPETFDPGPYCSDTETGDHLEDAVYHLPAEPPSAAELTLQPGQWQWTRANFEVRDDDTLVMCAQVPCGDDALEVPVPHEGWLTSFERTTPDVLVLARPHGDTRADIRLPAIDIRPNDVTSSITGRG